MLEGRGRQVKRLGIFALIFKTSRMDNDLKDAASKKSGNLFAFADEAQNKFFFRTNFHYCRNYQKNETRFKSGQNRLKKNNLVSLV